MSDSRVIITTNPNDDKKCPRCRARVTSMEGSGNITTVNGEVEEPGYRALTITLTADVTTFRPCGCSHDRQSGSWAPGITEATIHQGTGDGWKEIGTTTDFSWT